MKIFILYKISLNVYKICSYFIANLKTSIRLINIFNRLKGKDRPARYRITPKTRRQMNDLIDAGYTDEDFMRVVRRALSDQYHIDTNHKYVTPEFITRPDKFERYLNMNAPTTKKPKAFDNVI